MRKFTSLLLIMLLLFSLSACTTDDDEPIHVPPSNWYTADVCFSGYASDQGYWEYALNSDAAPAGMPIYKMESAQALADFKETMQPYFSFSAKKQNTSSFNEVTADYDDAFFAYNALLIVYVEASSGTFRYRVASVEISDETLTVTIDQYNDKGEHTDDMSGWLAAIKVPKEKLNGVTTYHTQDFVPNPYETYTCYAGYSDDEVIWDNAEKTALSFTSNPMHPVYKMETTDDLEAFQNTMGAYLHLGSSDQSSPNFYDATRNCDDAYFAKNALVVVYVRTTSGGDQYGVSSASIYSGTLAISLIQTKDGDTCDMSGLFIVLKIPKADLADVENYLAQG